jgi:hypothetical protein
VQGLKEVHNNQLTRARWSHHLKAGW